MRPSLEYVLKRREVDDGQLTEDGEGDGDDEEAVGGEADLGEDEALLRPRTQRVEHVEEDETGEGHRCVPRRHLAVLHHLSEHPQGAADNDGRRQQHVQD